MQNEIKDLAYALASSLDMQIKLQHFGRADLFRDVAEAIPDDYYMDDAMEDDMEGYRHPDAKA